MQYQHYHLGNNEAFILIKGLFIADGSGAIMMAFWQPTIKTRFLYQVCSATQWHRCKDGTLLMALHVAVKAAFRHKPAMKTAKTGAHLPLFFIHPTCLEACVPKGCLWCVFIHFLYWCVFLCEYCELMSWLPWSETVGWSVFGIR